MFTMKLFLAIIVLLVLVVQNTNCGQITRPTRSVSGIKQYFSEKISNTKAYIGTKINTAKNALSSLYTRGKKSLSNFTKNRVEKIQLKLQSYMQMAESTSRTIYDVIAPEYSDYNCTDQDPAKIMTSSQLIAIHGYKAETHTVVTEDGYILTLHRIPRSSYSQPSSNRTVLLHHGFLGSSIDWVLLGPNRSLPYILADTGYDVWMANARGNTYSRAHTVRNIDSEAFWNFTFQEIAQYDLPAVIDYIQEHKTGNEKIDYVGFSMGTTALFALLSTKTQYNDVLRAGYTLAPVAYMSGIKTPFKFLAKYGNTIETFLRLIGAKEVLPRNAVVRYMARHSCKVEDVQLAICEMSMFLLCGHDESHFDRSLMSVLLGHVPAGASTKTLVHFGQEVRNDGKFQKFDYGPEGNVREYGTTLPTEYRLNKITLPIFMMSAQDDWLSGVGDASKIYHQIVNPVEHYIVPDSEFNHLDFLFAKDVKPLVYDKLMTMIQTPIEQYLLDTNQVD